MNVLIVFNHPAPYKVRVFNELAKHVNLTVIFERDKESNRPDEFYSGNKFEFKYIILKDHYIAHDGSYSNYVRNYIKEHHSEFDHIVMNGYKHIAEMKAIKYMYKHGIKFSLLINGGIKKEKEFFVKRNLKTYYIPKADFYMSPSFNSDEYLKFYGAKKDRIFRYKYSNHSKEDILVDVVDKIAIRERYNLPVDKKIFVNAAQFIDRKNNLLLLSLFKDSEDFLLLIGDGPELNKYLDYIEDNNMKNVRIMPFQDRKDLFEIFSASDVYITLAKEDIFGHTVLEAMANGLPVISSINVNSGLEFIKDGYNGFLVQLDNIPLIKSRIEDAKEISSKGPVETAKLYTFEESANSILDILVKQL